MKKLLAREEERHPDLFHHLYSAIKPLMHGGIYTTHAVDQDIRRDESTAPKL